MNENNDTKVATQDAQEASFVPPKKRRALVWFKKIAVRYFITAFSGMTLGLFATLIAGTILQTLSEPFKGHIDAIYNFLFQIGYVAKIMMGAGIGAGIAYTFKAPRLVIISAIAAGFLGAFAIEFMKNYQKTEFSFGVSGSPGNPINSYLCAIVAVELGILVSGKTKFDIIVVPFVGLFAAGLIAVSVCRPVDWFILRLGKWIGSAAARQPFLMSVIISVSMGMLLTLPTSSAAIGYSAGISGIAGGAAVAGCCSHMIGFAVASFRENKWSGLVSQGLGTSMLQIPNVNKKPIILMPAVISSLICGPVAVLAFDLRCSRVGSGMGTAGLVGVIETVKASLDANLSVAKLIIGIVVSLFLLPAAISLAVSEFMWRNGWLKPGDMKLE